MLSVPATINTMHSSATILGDGIGQVVRKKTSKPSPQTRSGVKADERELHIQWLDWVIRSTGKSDSALALEAGSSENTLTRFRQRGGAVLSVDTISLIRKLTGLPGPEAWWLQNGAGLLDECEAYALTKFGEDPTNRMVAEALSGRAHAKAWVLKTRALAAAGYHSGDILIVDSSVEPEEGDVVCAQIFDLKSMGTKTVFRLLAAPHFLVAAPAFDDVKLRRPQVIDKERVQVLATVTETFRPRRH